MKSIFTIVFLSCITVGEVAAQVTPTPTGVTPSSGSGAYQTFVASWFDANGVNDISQEVLLIQHPNSTNGASQCIVRFDPPTNQLYLLVDQAGSWLGPITARTAGTLSNSQCILNGANSGGRVLDSTDSSVAFDVTFRAAFATSAPLGLFMYAVGSQGAGAYNEYGTWTVSRGAAVPSIVSLSPSSGSGVAVTFQATYSDPNGGMDIDQAVLLIQDPTSSTGANQCILRFDPVSNQLYLLVDPAGSWSGPISAGNNAQSLQNSQCSLSGGSAGRVSGTNLTVDFTVFFLGAFSGTKGLFLYALNPNGSGGYGEYGTWTVTNNGGVPSFAASVPAVITESIPSISHGSTCTDISGTWTENTSPAATWTLSQNDSSQSCSAQVCGRVQVNLPSCGTATWSVTGSLTNTSTGEFTLTSTNPNPSSCQNRPVPFATDTVTLSAPGCTSGTGVHSASDGFLGNTNWEDPKPAPRVPSSLKLQIGPLTSYSGGPIYSCIQHTFEGNGWGYRRCLTYTLLDASRKPIQNTTKYLAIETVTVVKATYEAELETGQAQVSNDGTFGDTLWTVSDAGPLPNGTKGVDKQTITIKDTTSGTLYPVRVNCLVYSAVDVVVHDVTTSGDQTCTTY